MVEKNRVEPEAEIDSQSVVVNQKTGFIDKAMHLGCFGVLSLCLLVLSGCAGRNIEKERISLGSQPFSPDGKYIIFSIHENNRINIYRINKDGSGLTGLTSSAEDNFDASYSPDGTQIVFSSTEGVQRTIPFTSNGPSLYKDFQRANLYLIDLNGSNKRRLTNSPGQYTSPIFSPDGQRIYFRFSRRFCDLYTPGSASFWGDSDVYSVDFDGTNFSAVTDEKFAELSPPSISPDGKRILIYALMQYERHYYEDGFWMFSIDQPRVKKLVAPNLSTEFLPEPGLSVCRSMSPFCNYTLYTPRFSPDGKLILFNVDRDTIVIMDLDSMKTKIIAKSAVIHEAVFSPDGSEILYVCDKTGFFDVYELWLVKVDGTGAHRIEIQGIKEIGNREGNSGNWIPGQLRRTNNK